MYPLLILAGGKATRMYPLTRNLPKSLIEVANMPFIHWQLRAVQRSGITNVILCLGHLSEPIKDFVGSGNQYSLDVQYSYDDIQSSGTFAAVRKACFNLKTPFYLLYGDSYFALPTEGFLKFAAKHNTSSIISVFKNQNKFDKSNIQFDDPKVKTYCNSPKNKSEFNYIDYGFSMFDPKQIEMCNKPKLQCFSEFIGIMADNGSLYGYEVFERFYEIGSIEGLEQFKSYIKNNKDYV